MTSKLLSFIDSDIIDYLAEDGGNGTKPNELLEWDLSHRGGYITYDLSEMGFRFKENPNGIDTRARTAQNYLGGGILGRITISYAFDISDMYKQDAKFLPELEKRLIEIHHWLTNHEGDEWEEQTIEQNQSMPISAY